MHQSQDTPLEQPMEMALADLSLHRVRLPGFFNALAAQLLHQDSPEEFDAQQVGVDPHGDGVYVVFWRTPQRARPMA